MYIKYNTYVFISSLPVKAPEHDVIPGITSEYIWIMDIYIHILFFPVTCHYIYICGIYVVDCFYDHFGTCLIRSISNTIIHTIIHWSGMAEWWSILPELNLGTTRSCITETFSLQIEPVSITSDGAWIYP